MVFEYREICSKQDALPLRLQIALPEEQEAIGILQIAHGMAEHKERYEALMAYLAERGFIVAVYDHRGHGESVRSKEDLGYFYDHGAYALVEDMHQVTQMLKLWYDQEQGKMPFYLLGHSMGSLAARVYIKQYDADLDGLIICGSPSYNPGNRFGRWLARRIEKNKGDHYRSKLLNILSFGPFVKSVKNAGSVFDWICSDQEVVHTYINDPLCGFSFTINGFINLFDLMNEAYSVKGWQHHNPDLRIWFISGKEDPCKGSDKNFIRSASFLKKQGYPFVQAKLYPGLRHEILNERGKEKIFADIAQQLFNWNQRKFKQDDSNS